MHECWSSYNSSDLLDEHEVCGRHAVIYHKLKKPYPHNDLNGRVLVKKSDHSLVGMEFDATREYPKPQKAEDDQNVAYLLMKLEDMENAKEKTEMCRVQKAKIYDYEVKLFGKS